MVVQKKLYVIKAVLMRLMEVFGLSDKDYIFDDYKATYFKRRELACRCCGVVIVNKELVKRLDLLRYKLGAPVIVNSGYRCESHNKAVGGAAGSYHLKGMAADIRCDKAGIDVVLREAKKLFPTAVKYQKQGFVHVDLGPSRSWNTD